MNASKNDFSSKYIIAPTIVVNRDVMNNLSTQLANEKEEEDVQTKRREPMRINEKNESDLYLNDIILPPFLRANNVFTAYSHTCICSISYPSKQESKKHFSIILQKKQVHLVTLD